MNMGDYEIISMMSTIHTQNEMQSLGLPTSWKDLLVDN
jgi:hypothetical protein